MDFALNFLGDFLAFSIDDLESILADVADVVDEALFAVIDVTEDGLDLALAVLENETFGTVGADVVDHTLVTVVDFTEDWLGDTGVVFDDEAIGTLGTDVVLIGTFETVHDVTFGDDDFGTGLAVGNNFESGNALLADSVVRAEVAVDDQTFGTFVSGQVELVFGVGALFASVLEETVITVIDQTLEALSGSDVGEVKKSWALGVVGTGSFDIAGVAELSWAFEARVTSFVGLESFEDTLGTDSVVGAGGTEGWAKVALAGVSGDSEGSTALFALTVGGAEFAILDVAVEAVGSGDVGEFVGTWAYSID